MNLKENIDYEQTIKFEEKYKKIRNLCILNGEIVKNVKKNLIF